MLLIQTIWHFITKPRHYSRGGHLSFENSPFEISITHQVMLLMAYECSIYLESHKLVGILER